MRTNQMKFTIIKRQENFAKYVLGHCALLFILTVFLISCKSGTNNSQNQSQQEKIDSIPSVIAQNDSLETIVKKIIDISANDFYKNQQPLPTTFRNVQIKYSIKPNKEILYILCGLFATNNKENGEWTHFTTIKNSDYEQWIGPNGLTYCENSKEIPYSKVNLSIELQNKINSLKKNK